MSTDNVAENCLTVNTMKTNILSCRLATGLLCGLSIILTTNAQAQISNGGFESGLAYPSGPNIFTAGTPNPWTATVFTPDCYDNSGADGWGLSGIAAYGGMFQNMFAFQGHRFLGFGAGTTFGEAFKQTMSQLTAGNQYTISAQMAVDDLGKSNSTFGGPYNGRGTIDVLINGVSVGQFAQNTLTYTWEQRSVTFIAPVASSYTVEFVAQTDALTRAPSYMALDDINVVPEPTSLLVTRIDIAGVIRKKIRR